MFEYEVFSGFYFPVLGLNVGIYSIYFLTQSKYGKLKTKEKVCTGKYLTYLGQKVSLVRATSTFNLEPIRVRQFNRKAICLFLPYYSN